MRDSHCSPRTRSRRLWDKHGSWLVLMFVIGVSFNAGVEWEGMKRNQIVTSILASGVAERDELRKRLRTLSDSNMKLTGKVEPTLEKANEAVKKADEVIEKADRAIGSKEQ